VLRVRITVGAYIRNTHCGRPVPCLWWYETALEGQIGWMRAIGWIALVVIYVYSWRGLAFLEI